jgi:hypothetical protein
MPECPHFDPPQRSVAGPEMSVRVGTAAAVTMCKRAEFNTWHSVVYSDILFALSGDLLHRNERVSHEPRIAGVAAVVGPIVKD